MTSYVDPTINAAVISQIDLRRDLANLMQLDFPEIYLPTFLHEGTHHSCFMSPLGTALALLRMRAYRRAARLRTCPADDDERWELLEDVLRQETTMEALRPLAEGLACFSELDSVPGKSNVLTVPMGSTFANFGGLEKKISSQDINLFLYSLLYRARLSPDLTQRRENVLASDFTVESGGYLSGYMAIKNLWRQACQNSELAGDAELFSAFIRSYFYDDYAFVDVLLAPSLREQNAVNAIGSYFIKRLKQWLQCNWAGSLSEFEKHYGRLKESKISRVSVRHPQPGGLDSDKRRCVAGESRLDQLFLELHETTGVRKFETTLRGFDSVRMQARELLCLGSLEGEVEINSFGRVLIRADDGEHLAKWPTMAVSATEKVKQGKGSGSLEFYLIPLDNSRASVVMRGSELVFAQFEGPIHEEKKTQLKGIFQTRSHQLMIIERQEKLLAEIIDGDTIGVVREAAKKNTIKAVDEIYSWLATMSAGKDQWKSAVSLLEEGGIYRVVRRRRRVSSGLGLPRRRNLCLFD
jgi:hypothetical protein